MVGVEIPLTVWRHDTGYVGVPASVTRPIPVVIDNARDMYFRPEGGELLLIGLEDENVIGGSPDRDTGDPEPDFWDKVTDRITSRIPGIVEGTFRAAHAGVRIAQSNGHVELDVCDDGRGMAAVRASDGHFGLRGLRGRLQRLLSVRQRDRRKRRAVRRCGARRAHMR